MWVLVLGLEKNLGLGDKDWVVWKESNDFGFGFGLKRGAARGISFGFGSKVLKKGEKVRRGEERFDLEEVEFDLKDKLWKEG